MYLTLKALLEISDEQGTEIATVSLFIPTPCITGVIGTHWNNREDFIIFS